MPRIVRDPVEIPERGRENSRSEPGVEPLFGAYVRCDHARPRLRLAPRSAISIGWGSCANAIWCFAHAARAFSEPSTTAAIHDAIAFDAT